MFVYQLMCINIETYLRNLTKSRGPNVPKTNSPDTSTALIIKLKLVPQNSITQYAKIKKDNPIVIIAIPNEEDPNTTYVPVANATIIVTKAVKVNIRAAFEK